MATEWLTAPHTGAPGKRAGLAGCWERTLLRTADGRLDTQTRVAWLQGPSLFVDLRIPADGPAEGFAGVLSHAGGVFEWRHEIDLAPSAKPDAGTLEWDGGLLIERGVNEAYVEHWRRAPGAAGPCWGVRLADSRGERHAVLVRAGTHLGWAGGPGETRICQARISGDSAVVTRSSRPMAAGARLRWAFHPMGMTIAFAGPAGEERSAWQVTYSEGDVPASAGARVAPEPGTDPLLSARDWPGRRLAP